MIRDIVTAAFHQTADTLAVESRHVPLSDHNESVCRYFYCRAVGRAFPAVQQLVEADRIDLVLKDRELDEVAFIEFKFYVRRPRVSADSGPTRGFKGGPSDKNLREFTRSIDRLAHHPGAPGLSRFIVTFYADPPPSQPSTLRFADYLDRYEHPTPSTGCSQLATSGPAEAGALDLRGSVLEVVPTGRR